MPYIIKGDDKIKELCALLLTTRKENKLLSIRIEDSPVLPYVHAASYFKEQKDVAYLDKLIHAIDAEVDGRIFHRDKDLSQLKDAAMDLRVEPQ